MGEEVVDGADEDDEGDDWRMEKKVGMRSVLILEIWLGGLRTE